MERKFLLAREVERVWTRQPLRNDEMRRNAGLSLY
jgi:hypothetical protein